SALPESIGPTGKRSARKRACSVWSGGKAAKPYLSLPRQHSGSSSACLSYPTAFTYTRRREPSPARGGIRGDLSASLCHPCPRFSPFSRVDNTCVGAHRTFAGVCSWRAMLLGEDGHTPPILV